MFSAATVRQKILPALVPLFVLLTVRGTAGICMLYQLSGRIDSVIQENYASVIAMQDIKNALRGMDTSFQFTIIAQKLKEPNEAVALKAKAFEEIEQHWQRYEEALARKQSHTTPRQSDASLINQMTELARQCHAHVQEFRQNTDSEVVRDYTVYEACAGIRQTLAQAEQAADEILRWDQAEMKKSATAAERTADSALVWLTMGLASAVLLVFLTVRQILP